jgi:hypothetical protein
MIEKIYVLKPQVDYNRRVKERQETLKELRRKELEKQNCLRFYGLSRTEKVDKKPTASVQSTAGAYLLD